MKCLFCNENEAIKNSHIIPKFFFDWLKRTGRTKYLRSTSNPNKAVQDGLKIELLCKHCEHIFSLNENDFNKKVFLQIANYRKPFDSTIIISDSMRKMIYSIVWRVIASNVYFDQPDQFSTDEVNFLASFLPKVKQAYNTGTTSEFKTYFLPLIPKMLNQAKLKTSNYYLDRVISMEPRIYDNEYSKLVIYIKLPFMIIVCELISNKLDYWDCCQIETLNVMSDFDMIEIPEYVKYLITKGNNDCISSFDKISKKQKEIILNRWNQSPKNTGLDKTIQKDFPEKE